MSWIELLFWICSFLAFYTYIGYPVLLIGISIFASKQRHVDGNHWPSVSILITAFNEDAVIEEKLQNCRALDYPEGKLEILIGSDGSTDRTDEILQKHANDAIRFISFAQRRGKAAVLNDIAQLAQGEILVFSDANSMYHGDAIKKLVAYFVDRSVGGVCGRLVLLNPNGKVEAEGERLYWDFENYLKHLEGKIKTVVGANGAIYAIRRELFKPLPTDKVVMDDFLIPLSVVRAGYDVVYEKNAVAWEFAAPNVNAEFKRKVRIGAANFHGIREVLSLLVPLKGFIAFGLWSHKIIRWMVPFLLLAVLAANLQLLGRTFYDALFALQAILYGLAIIAWILDRFNVHVRWLIYPHYFVMANLALFVGFLKFVTRTQKPAWTRVER